MNRVGNCRLSRKQKRLVALSLSTTMIVAVSLFGILIRPMPETLASLLTILGMAGAAVLVAAVWMGQMERLYPDQGEPGDSQQGLRVSTRKPL